jgi:hypothetical protein
MLFKAACDAVPVSPEPASFQHRMDSPRDLLDRDCCDPSLNDLSNGEWQAAPGIIFM